MKHQKKPQVNLSTILRAYLATGKTLILIIKRMNLIYLKNGQKMTIFLSYVFEGVCGVLKMQNDPFFQEKKIENLTPDGNSVTI